MSKFSKTSSENIAAGTIPLLPCREESSLVIDPDRLLSLHDEISRIASMLVSFRDKGSAQSGSLVSSTKTDGSLVSDADLLASNSILEYLKGNFPSHLLISEELEHTHELLNAGIGEQIWIIDPLDNSRGYINGRDDYSILLTRMVAGRAIDAIISHPSLNSLVSIQDGGGVWRHGQQLKVSSTNEGSIAAIAGIYYDGLSNISDAPVESTEGLLAVAEGKIDIALIKVCGHKIWDLAFATLLLQEADGQVSDNLGSPLNFDRVDVQAEWLVATNGNLHSYALNYLDNFLKIGEV